MSTCVLNDSLINMKKKNLKEKISKEVEIPLKKTKTNKRNLNSMSNFQNKKDGKMKKSINFEKRNTYRYLNGFHEKRQKNLYNIIKREKSADYLKKKSSSLRERIKHFFNEIAYHEINNLVHNNYKNGKTNNCKNYNTLNLIKKTKDDIMMEGKRKSYFSPEKLDQHLKNNCYKRLLSLRTVSGVKNNNNNDLFINIYKENLNINNNNIILNNDENNYGLTMRSNLGIKNQKKRNKRINNNNNNNNNNYNNKRKNSSKNLIIKKNRYDNNNALYISQNNYNNLLDSQKINNKNKNNNPLCKSSNISSMQNKLKKNQNIKSKNSNDDKSPSLERITVNKNEENNIYNNINMNINNISVNLNNNCNKINVRKIDSMINYNTNNSININLNKMEIDESKINKKNEVCFTDENELINKNFPNEKVLIANNIINYHINNRSKETKINSDDMSIKGIEYSFHKDKDGKINNIRVCKNPEFQSKKKQKIDNTNTNTNTKKKQNTKKRSGTVDPFHENNSPNVVKSGRAKNKTPNKESIFTLRHFQKYMMLNNNVKNNIHCYSNNNSIYYYYYHILPGNNGKLVEKVLRTRENWDVIDSSQPQCANLIWTPLSCQINYTQHAFSEITQYVNHFEFHSELTNKANTFINLFRYCEFNDIDLFSFYPLTIILSSNQDYLQTQIEGFKKCYQNIQNLINNDEENNTNAINECYINYFFVNLSKKIGSTQKMKIPKSFYIGRNLWVLKRTNLNRGRQMKVLSNIDDIIKEINLMFEEKKPNNLIIQKYLEAPLLYNERKFDIRIWVLFTYVGKDNVYEVFVFKEGHLKACCDLFNIDSDNLFIHLTNYSVQKHNKNFSKVEIGNEISFQLFQQELNRQNTGKNFKKDIFPEIVKIIGISANAVKNKINMMDRKKCFEIFGYDFILDINCQPFLLEINTNPGLEESSPLIKMLVPRMIDDAFRLTIDKTFDNNDGNGKKINSSKYHVDGYTDEENMWMKIKTKKCSSKIIIN